MTQEIATSALLIKSLWTINVHVEPTSNELMEYVNSSVLLAPSYTKADVPPVRKTKFITPTLRDVSVKMDTTLTYTTNAKS